MAIVLLFTIVGGIFAAAETALITLRDSQVKKLAASGRRGRRLEKLMLNPNRFLGAVQVGVTFAGFLSAGYGASRIVPTQRPSATRVISPACGDQRQLCSQPSRKGLAVRAR